MGAGVGAGVGPGVGPGVGAVVGGLVGEAGGGRIVGFFDAGLSFLSVPLFISTPRRDLFLLISLLVVPLVDATEGTTRRPSAATAESFIFLGSRKNLN